MVEASEDPEDGSIPVIQDGEVIEELERIKAQVKDSNISF